MSRQVTAEGRLIVFEGPDGVGKSTLAAALTARFRESGVPSDLMTFPGREPGTLGSLVYRVHHEPGQFGIGTVDPTSLQLLHIAAHIDAIKGRIRPALAAGRTVILDRFWWSTWVYGIESGVPRDSLRAMIDLEKEHWEGNDPDVMFLIQRETPFRVEHDAVRFRRLSDLYLDLVDNTPDQDVYLIKNEGSVDSETARLWEVIHGAQ